MSRNSVVISDDEAEIWAYKSQCRRLSTNQRGKTTGRRSSTQIKAEPGCQAKSRKRKKKNVNTNPNETVPVNAAVKCEATPDHRLELSSHARVGFCPICQVPFELLSSIESPSWHIDLCLAEDKPSTTKQECHLGANCRSESASHYQKFRHTQLARTRRKSQQKSESLGRERTGDVTRVRTVLNFDEKVSSQDQQAVFDSANNCIDLDASPKDSTSNRDNTRKAADDNNVVADMDSVSANVDRIHTIGAATSESHETSRLSTYNSSLKQPAEASTLHSSVHNVGGDISDGSESESLLPIITKDNDTDEDSDIDHLPVTNIIINSKDNSEGVCETNSAGTENAEKNVENGFTKVGSHSASGKQLVEKDKDLSEHDVELNQDSSSSSDETVDEADYEEIVLSKQSGFVCVNNEQKDKQKKAKQQNVKQGKRRRYQLPSIRAMFSSDSEGEGTNNMLKRKQSHLQDGQDRCQNISEAAKTGLNDAEAGSKALSCVEKDNKKGAEGRKTVFRRSTRHCRKTNMEKDEGNLNQRQDHKVADEKTEPENAMVGLLGNVDDTSKECSESVLQKVDASDLVIENQTYCYEDIDYIVDDTSVTISQMLDCSPDSEKGHESENTKEPDSDADNTLNSESDSHKTLTDKNREHFGMSTPGDAVVVSDETSLSEDTSDSSDDLEILRTTISQPSFFTGRNRTELVKNELSGPDEGKINLCGESSNTTTEKIPHHRLQQENLANDKNDHTKIKSKDKCDHGDSTDSGIGFFANKQKNRNKGVPNPTHDKDTSTSAPSTSKSPTSTSNTNDINEEKSHQEKNTRKAEESKGVTRLKQLENDSIIDEIVENGPNLEGQKTETRNETVECGISSDTGKKGIKLGKRIMSEVKTRTNDIKKRITKATKGQQSVKTFFPKVEVSIRTDSESSNDGIASIEKSKCCQNCAATVSQCSQHTACSTTERDTGPNQNSIHIEIVNDESSFERLGIVGDARTGNDAGGDNSCNTSVTNMVHRLHTSAIDSLYTSATNTVHRLHTPAIDAVNTSATNTVIPSIRNTELSQTLDNAVNDQLANNSESSQTGSTPRFEIQDICTLSQNTYGRLCCGEGGGFIPDTDDPGIPDIPENRLLSILTNGTPNTSNSPVSNLPCATESIHSTQSSINDAVDSMSENEVLGFVTQKVTQIQRNAAEILMASSRFLYNQSKQQGKHSKKATTSAVSVAASVSGNDTVTSGSKHSVNDVLMGARGHDKPTTLSDVHQPARHHAGNNGSVGRGNKTRRWGQHQQKAESQASEELVKRKCPFYKKIPDTSFTVDAFSYGLVADCNVYFLSHFHADHYMGLKKSFTGHIYCSKITSNLVKKKIGVDGRYVHTVPLNVPTEVDGVQITFLEANHCPGAVLILFKLRSGRVYLHTGDFRATSAMETLPQLQGLKVHMLYLDTTYCDPQYDFPPQEEVIACALKLVQDTLASNPRTLIVCGCYTIGKERIFTAIAEALNCKICVMTDKKSVLDCQEDAFLRDRVTVGWSHSQLHVLPMNKLGYKGLHEHLLSHGRGYDSVLGIEPTGWTHSKKKVPLSQIQPKVNRDNVKIYGLPYSEHSSFLEMKRFVQFIKADRILPTVNNGNAHSRRKMEVIFQAWREEKHTS